MHAQCEAVCERRCLPPVGEGGWGGTICGTALCMEASIFRRPHAQLPGPGRVFLSCPTCTWNEVSDLHAASENTRGNAGAQAWWHTCQPGFGRRKNACSATNIILFCLFCCVAYMHDAQRNLSNSMKRYKNSTFLFLLLFCVNV